MSIAKLVCSFLGENVENLSLAKEYLSFLNNNQNRRILFLPMNILAMVIKIVQYNRIWDRCVPIPKNQ